MTTLSPYPRVRGFFLLLGTLWTDSWKPVPRVDPSPERIWVDDDINIDRCLPGSDRGEIFHWARIFDRGADSYLKRKNVIEKQWDLSVRVSTYETLENAYYMTFQDHIMIHQYKLIFESKRGKFIWERSLFFKSFE